MDARSFSHRCATIICNRVSRTHRLARAAFAMVAFHDHWPRAVSDETRFLAFCSALRPIAHGQILQDLWVLFETDLASGGVFVEFGAYDGEIHSNTKLLEERFGWSGVLAEPNAALAEGLRRSRSAAVDDRCVWDESGQTIQFSITDDAELSTVMDFAQDDLHTAARHASVAEMAAVRTVSLDDLLTEHRVSPGFDFLSVDTEGTELRILRAFDFDRFRPRLVAVEHNHRADQKELDDMMRQHGYERRFPAMSDWDAWYRRTGE